MASRRGRARARGRGRSRSWDTGPPIPGPGVAKLVQTHTVAAELPVESQFADAQQQETAQTNTSVGQSDVITIKVYMSSLSLGMTTDEIGNYLESQGANVEVLSVTDLGSGNSEVKIVGYTTEELEWLQKREHRFKKQSIEINVVGTLPDEPLQSFPLESSTTYDYEPSDIIPDVIKVTGFPSSDVDIELLELYFESPKSGGCANAVAESSIIAAGIAHIKFKSQEVAARIISQKNHNLHGCTLHITHVRKPKDEPNETDRLLISNLPPGMDHDFLLLFLENVLKMEETEFSVAVIPDQLALIVFHKDYTVKELEGMIAKIEKKPLKKAFVHVELCRMSRSIEISNISKHYDDEYLKMYFENHRKSGGGNVTSVELLGNGKAVVAFEDPEVLKDVVAKNALTVFGENAVLKRKDPFGQLSRDSSAVKATTTSSVTTIGDNTPPMQTSLQPLNINIDPLVAKCIQTSQEGLAEHLQHLSIQQIEINEKEGVIVIIPTQRTISGWQQECQERITSYVHSNFAKSEMVFPNEAEADVRRNIMNIQEEATLVVIFNPDNTGFTAAGDCNVIAMLEARTKEVSARYMQVQEDETLKPEDYCYFTQVKAHQLKEIHPELSIKYNPTDNVLHLSGSVQDVSCFRQSLPEYVHHTSISMQDMQHPLVIQYLSSGDGMQQLKNFIQSQKKDVQLATYFKQEPQNQLKLSFLCDQANAESAEAIVTALYNATKEQVDQLPRSFTSLSQVDSGEYYQLCQSLEKQQHVQIVTSEGNLQVSIGGFSSGVTYSSQTLQQFIKEKCTLAKPVEIERGVWRLFCGPMISKWNSIELHCKQKQVEVSIPDENATDPEVILKGETELVEELSQEIITLTKSVATKQVLLSRPGTCRYFKEDETAKLLLAGIEKDQKVCIEVVEVDKAESDDEDFAQARDSSQFTKVCVARTKEFKQITIYVGDITEFNKADVLVNAANADLAHVGGVAKAIADKGGPIIQKESTQYVRSKGRLEDGDVWLTKKVGNLQCKALVHTVGPQWRGGGAKEEAHLSKACFQSLKQASMYRSIALPAISSGVYGFPLVQCADVLVKTVVDFSEQNPLTELQEIYFILFKDSDAQVFADAVKKHLPADNIVSEKRHTAPSASAMHTASRKKSKQDSKHIPVHDCIQVHRGSLLTVKADVYVNTTNTNLDLTQGAVAQTLAKAAGPNLQAECTRKAPVSVGNITVTKAGNIPSRHIIHVVAPSYDGPGGQAEKILRNLIQKCMKECTRLKVSSIAFPALGAGNLRYPSSVVAKIMVREVSSFLAANRNTSLTSVHLVIYMEDTYQAFKREIASGKSVYSPSAPPMPSKTKSKHSSRSVPTRSHGATPEYAPSGANIAITFGDIKVQIIHGDISDDCSDAIVNTTNPELQLSGPGVSGALLRKGGKQLQQLCDTVRMQGSRLESGKVLVTAATGKLQCKLIFHTIFEDLPKFVKTMNVCLQKAEEHKFKSIAFPAVGTGTHAHPAEGVANAMIKAIRQFASSKHTHVTCVNFVLFDAEVYQIFLRVLQEASQPGFWTRTKDWIGSLMLSQSASDQDNDESVVNNPYTSSASYEEINRELEFKLYGETTRSVQQAEEKLFKLIEGQFITDQIDDPNVGKLPHSDIVKLTTMSKNLHVEIEINSEPLNYIRLKGDRAELQQLKFYILKVLSSFEKRESQQREAQHLQKIIQWKWQDSQETLQDYDIQENYEIEQAHSSGKSTYTHNSTSEHYTIDFQTMKETNHSSGDTYTVVRADLEKQYREGDRPQSWSPMPKDTSGKEEPVHLVDLLQGEEYKKVLTEFNRTMNPGSIASGHIAPVQHGQPPGGIATLASLQGAIATPASLRGVMPKRGVMATPVSLPAVSTARYGGTTIEKICRVQNPMLYRQYQTQKKEMDKQNPPGHKNEWLLWHGTRSSTCQKINTQGFNRSFAGQNATVFGRGVYFARDASYSARDTYSPRDQNGYKYMYLVRVLVGEYTVGNSSMIVPPPKDPSKNPNILFDSVVDNSSNPQVFVVFHDATAYPEYMVVFS